ncbi:uncharacterized protein LOC119364673 isoform X2 [Triticum dicoccoides]|uniref:uncharacterized protein LOC119364673 isoform X2 n=1 Tax=Triticum dicoccoides TaxID=85692 RepID=UPI00188EFE15|nr:uncharacterized protein LOC119364673 isoform X2 [Triticum dicoccoides]XP_044324916.1 uncharacterized protein LOC123045805 isoform X2 [Triticum aestivum]
MAAAESKWEEWNMVAAEESKGEGSWSTSIHRVAPGKDFVNIPFYADEGPAWSLLVGVMRGDLRFHRLRVARSGRISGRSNEVVEIFHDLKKPPGCSLRADAALAPDGRSLCVVQQVENEQTYALQLQLEAEEKLRPLPPLAWRSLGRCMPISADGHIWAVSAIQLSVSSFHLVMQRLFTQEEEDAAGGRWELVGRPFKEDCKFDRSLPTWDGSFLQGYVVLPGHGLDGGTLILLSLQNGLFFTFDCLAAPEIQWTKVTHTSDEYYLPINGRGLYAQESNAIYMLWNNVVYEYKLTVVDEEEERGLTRLKLHPPARIDSVCPFITLKGDGFLTHLGWGVMCSVWISLDLSCGCDYLHAIVTTFQIGPLPGDVKVLHSTFRRVDMLPMKHMDEFKLCFVQEYMDDKVLPQLQEEVLDDPCRHYLPPSPPKYEIKMDEIPMLERAPPLKPHYIVHGDDDGPRHFFLSSSKLCAISFLKDGMDVFNLDTTSHTMDILARRPVSVDPFVMVIRVGRATFALTETLQVYHKAYRVSPPGSTSWVRYHTNQSNVLDRKVMLSGYVAVGDDSFIVSDSVTCSCLLFEVGAKQWHVVIPWTQWGEYLPRPMPRHGLLKGACVFVDGFIYTCSNCGLAAYELLFENDHVYLKGPIFLPFSWLSKQWESERMSLDYAGKEVDSGAILLWVVQGVQVQYRPPKNQLWITAVRVETEETPCKSMRPVEIKHVLCATPLIDQVEGIDQEEVTRTTCFGVSS